MFVKMLKSLVRTTASTVIGLLILYVLIRLAGNAAWASGASAALASLLDSDVTADTSVPLLMNYQGMLRDAEGNPLSGYYTLTLRIYDDITALPADALWAEEHVSVTVRSGDFSVLLGDSTALSPTFFGGPDRFIGVTVDPFNEMVPRQRFASVPYAVYAERAYALSSPDGDPLDAVFVNDAGNVGIGTTSPAHQLDVFGDGAAGAHISMGGHALTLKGVNDPVAYGPLLPYIDWRQADGVRAMYLGWGQTSDPKWVDMGLENGYNLAIRGGNVGIGTTIPEAKLDVDGSARIRGDLAAWDAVVDDLTVSDNLTVVGDLTVEGDINFRIFGTYRLDSQNGDIPDSLEMPSTDFSFCVLTSVKLRDVDDGTEEAGCTVIEYGGSWWLDAYSEQNADAWCEARCLVWGS